jgi:hypothetical protein
MARRRNKGRSIGEMISTLCFFGVAIFFFIDGMAAREDGDGQKSALLLLAALLCFLGGLRFTLADLAASWKGRRK